MRALASQIVVGSRITICEWITLATNGKKAGAICQSKITRRETPRIPCRQMRPGHSRQKVLTQEDGELKSVSLTSTDPRIRTTPTIAVSRHRIYIYISIHTYIYIHNFQQHLCNRPTDPRGIRGMKVSACLNSSCGRKGWGYGERKKKSTTLANRQAPNSLTEIPDSRSRISIGGGTTVKTIVSSLSVVLIVTHRRRARLWRDTMRARVYIRWPGCIQPCIREIKVNIVLCIVIDRA